VRKLKLAFLGAGDVAQRDYLPELHRLAERVELVAVCSRTPERARAAAEQYGAGAWYTDYHRLLAESGADAVVNLTPIQLHAETTLAALAAGKHVFTEKPAATTTEEAARIRDEAGRRGLIVVCAPCVMIFPQVRRAQSLLEEGAIGKVYAARGHGHGGVPPWSGYASDPSPFFARGGGPAMDMGVYPLHALTGLLGPARRVTAMAAHAQQSFVVADGPAEGKRVPIEVEDNWQMILDFGGERLASVAATNCVAGTRAPQLELFGLRGTIAADLLDMTAPVEVLRSGQGWEQIAAPEWARRAGPDHVLGIEHLADCVQEGARPVLSVDHALHVVEIIEKAAVAAHMGQSQDVTSTFGV
jgi:predicted dehydrogenase